MSNTANLVLAVKNLSCQIQSKFLLSDVNIDLKAGELVAIIGRNGAGKSTLLKHATGEMKSAQGSIEIFEKPLGSYHPRDLAKKRAVLPQSTHLNFDYRVLDVVLLGRIPHQKRQVETSEDVSIAQNCLYRVGLKGYENRSYLTLSGGEQQRVHLARTLAQLQGTSGPRLLFLDEPTSSLDLAHQHHILSIARELTAEGVGVLAVLHDLNLTAQYADRIVVMSEGRVLAYGTPREVLTESILLEAFHYNVIIAEHPCFDCPLVIAGQPLSIDTHN